MWCVKLVIVLYAQDCLRAQPLYGSLEIRSRLLFAKLKEQFRRVDPIAREKLFENLRPLVSENIFRHPRIFLSHLCLVFPESVFRMAQDAQVNVDEKGSINVFRWIVSFGHQNKIANRIAKIRVRAGICQALLREYGALFLVVWGVRVVDDVVKPDGQFHGEWLRSEVPRRVEFRQTLHDMLRPVVVTVRLLISL